MATEDREPNRHLAPFWFLIKQDRAGRHRWYLYNAAGTIVGSHAAGFPGELEACQDVERFRRELANAPIIGGSTRRSAAARPDDGAERHALGGRNRGTKESSKPEDLTT
jgi:hypothetical protein